MDARLERATTGTMLELLFSLEGTPIEVERIATGLINSGEYELTGNFRGRKIEEGH